MFTLSNQAYLENMKALETQYIISEFKRRGQDMVRIMRQALKNQRKPSREQSR